MIATALGGNPDVLIADEPTSALDAPLRAQIINLLVDLKERFDLTLLLISHDLRVVRYVSDRVAVMYLGKIVELRERDAVFENPLHPCTRVLIAASLLEEKGLAAGDDVRGEPPSPLPPPDGCAVHPRCAIARPRCAVDEPRLAGERGGHRSGCFFPGTHLSC